MQISVVNRRARARYGVFWGALQFVDEALTNAERSLMKIDDKAHTGDWRVPEPGEIRHARDKAEHALEVLTKTAKKWEAELVSRDWRR